MLRQNSAIIQTNCSKQEMEKEFESIEEIITKVFEILEEYDRLMKTAEIEMKKLEVNQ